MNRLVVICVACLASAGTASGGGEITLRRAARVADGAPVRLADVARLSESERSRIGGIEIELDEARASAARIGLEDVIVALREAGVDPAR